MKRIILIALTGFSLNAMATELPTSNEPAKKTTAQRFDYPAEWEAFKEAVKKKDKEIINMMNKAEGVDADMILMFFEDPDFMKQLQATKYSDLTANDFNGTPVVEFSATVSGKDDEGNEYESGIFLYFDESGSGLKLVNVLAAG